MGQIKIKIKTRIIKRIDDLTDQVTEKTPPRRQIRYSDYSQKFIYYFSKCYSRYIIHSINKM